MPRSSLTELSALALAGATDESGPVEIDLAIDLVHVPRSHWSRRGPGVGDHIMRVGGRWDRRRGEYTGDARQVRQVFVQDGQLEAARWFCSWLEAWIEGTPLDPAIYTAAFVGGRRGGKSDLGVTIAGALAPIAMPGSIAWIVTPEHEKDEGDEIQRAVQELLPASWYQWRGNPKRTFTLANRSKIMLRSSYKPARMKKGRADIVLLNEAQEMPETTYVHVRAPIADRRGLVILAANPPDKPIGEWVSTMVEETRAGKRPATRVFTFDPRLNPAIDHASLDAIQGETDSDTFRREILGEFLPPRDRVLYAFSPTHNVAPFPDVGDATEAVLRKHFGRPFRVMITADFQRSPHMAAGKWRWSRNPADASDPLMWRVGEFVVEQGDEDDLIDAFEGEGLRGDEVAVVADASGEWQDADRSGWRGSYDMFRRRGWRWIYPPDVKMKKNPMILERVAAANARFCDAAGVRRLFLTPDLEHSIAAVKRWENKQGFPHRRSRWAHIGDELTYGVWRFYPRRRGPGSVERMKVDRIPSVRRRDLEVW